MQTQAVMERYRELGGSDSLEASVQVQKEAEEKGDFHWHRIHERCWCGYLTVPAACYEHDKRGVQVSTQAQAEKKYLASLSDETTVTKRQSDEIGASPAHVKKAVPTDGGAQPGRPKKHADHAARQRAYRERSRG